MIRYIWNVLWTYIQYGYEDAFKELKRPFQRK